MAEGWQQPPSLPWDPSQTLLMEANEMTGGSTGDNLGVKRCAQRRAGSGDSEFTMLTLCQVGHPSKGRDVAGTLVSAQRLDCSPFRSPCSQATCMPTQRIPPSFASMLVTHTELEKEKKCIPKHCYFGFMKNRLFTR